MNISNKEALQEIFRIFTERFNRDYNSNQQASSLQPHPDVKISLSENGVSLEIETPRNIFKHIFSLEDARDFSSFYEATRLLLTNPDFIRETLTDSPDSQYAAEYRESEINLDIEFIQVILGDLLRATVFVWNERIGTPARVFGEAVNTDDAEDYLMAYIPRFGQNGLSLLYPCRLIYPMLSDSDVEAIGAMWLTSINQQFIEKAAHEIYIMTPEIKDTISENTFIDFINPAALAVENTDAFMKHFQEKYFPEIRDYWQSKILSVFAGKDDGKTQESTQSKEYWRTKVYYDSNNQFVKVVTFEKPVLRDNNNFEKINTENGFAIIQFFDTQEAAIANAKEIKAKSAAEQKQDV